MHAIVLSSPRSLSKPRPFPMVKSAPAVAAVLKSVATAVVRGFRGATDLAVRVQQAAAAPRPQARWVASRQVESPEPFSFAVPAPLAEPRQVKVTKFLDIWD